ncbi:hypothetical protein ABEB36_013298 [Hypothenemus hampei]|uniref:G-protein coupled receptors family 2 profile 2 domain-containing protein n=1 Tax=Hypothenemus hampei TaxID=57062 RepID=A0ABD1E9K2_HYPHA
MIIKALLLYSVFNCFIQQSVQNFVKCCQKDFQVIQLENTTFQCSNTTHTRLQIQSKQYDTISNNTLENIQCVDIFQDAFHIFQLDGRTLTSNQLLDRDVFTKCCPLNHWYHKSTRSCSKQNHEEITTQFIKIGLPHCKLIIDHTFSNLSDAVKWTQELDLGTFCLDSEVAGQYVVRKCQENLNVCQSKTCVKKCCPDGQSFVGGGICRDTYHHGLRMDSPMYSRNFENISDDYELIYGTKCEQVSIDYKKKYNVDENGEIHVYHIHDKKYITEPYYEFRSYCLEYAVKKELNVSGYHIFWCKTSRLDDKFAFTLWAKIFSCICLVFTILIYFYLDEFKSTFGKILISYCIAMIGLLVSLTVAHLRLQWYLAGTTECKFRGYLLIFFVISNFTWVNVMSLDIWWTFGTPKRTIGSDQRRKDLKKFLLYMLYGWGVPFLHTLSILFFDFYKILPESIQPHVGIHKCFIEFSNQAHEVFLLVPQLFFQIINTVMFIKTIIYCIKVKNEIRRMNDSARSGRYNADKGRLLLVIKLAVIMGIIWIGEVTSAFFDMSSYSTFTKYLEVVLDTFTCLQGFFIFLIFICKKRIHKKIKKKLGFGERRISGTLSDTQSSLVNAQSLSNKRQMCNN